MNAYLRTALEVLGAVVVAVTGATAQTQISSNVIGTGGGRMTGEAFTILGTVGQAVIGPTAGQSLVAGQGFWYTYTPGGVSSVDERYITGREGATELLRNAPNPFNEWTEFELRVPRRSHVTLRIFDALGRLVRTVIDGERDPGTIALRMDTEGLTSGRYTAQLLVGTERTTATLIVVK
jgi:hypothetical protein